MELVMNHSHRTLESEMGMLLHKRKFGSFSESS